jgi:uncharacterized membrane protein YfcA
MPDTLIDFLFPSALPPWQVLSLMGLSFFTSFMSASVGIGGGTALLGIMAATIPVNVLIAVHALVQVGSNAGRAWVQRAHIHWPIALQYAAGGIVGAIAGGLFFVALPERVLLLILGIFILWMVWGPKIRIPHIERWGIPLLGVIGVFLSSVIGTTAAMINAVLRRKGLPRRELIGTQAACVLSQHILKTIVFVSLGIALQEWIGMIIVMIITGFVGTWLGSKLLNVVPEHVFDIILKVVLTAAGLHLLWQGISS